MVKPIHFSLKNLVILDSKTISITDYFSAWHHLLISLPASERMQAVEIWFDCISLTEGVLNLRKKKFHRTASHETHEDIFLETHTLTLHSYLFTLYYGMHCRKNFPERHRPNIQHLYNKKEQRCDLKWPNSQPIKSAAFALPERFKTSCCEG